MNHGKRIILLFVYSILVFFTPEKFLIAQLDKPSTESVVREIHSFVELLDEKRTSQQVESVDSNFLKNDLSERLLFTSNRLVNTKIKQFIDTNKNNLNSLYLYLYQYFFSLQYDKYVKELAQEGLVVSLADYENWKKKKLALEQIPERKKLHRIQSSVIDQNQLSNEAKNQFKLRYGYDFDTYQVADPIKKQQHRSNYERIRLQIEAMNPPQNIKQGQKEVGEVKNDLQSYFDERFKEFAESPLIKRSVEKVKSNQLIGWGENDHFRAKFFHVLANTQGIENKKSTIFQDFEKNIKAPNVFITDTLKLKNALSTYITMKGVDLQNEQALATFFHQQESFIESKKMLAELAKKQIDYRIIASSKTFNSSKQFWVVRDQVEARLVDIPAKDPSGGEVKDSVQLIFKKRNLLNHSIPTPLYYQISNIECLSKGSLKSLSLSISKGIFGSHTVIGGAAECLGEVRVTYQKNQRMAKPSKISIEIETHRWKKYLSSLREVGAEQLADHLEKKFNHRIQDAKELHLSMREFAKELSTAMFYPYKEIPKNKKINRKITEDNPLSWLREYIDDQGATCLQCTGARKILTDSLRFLTDDNSIELIDLTVLGSNGRNKLSKIFHVQLGVIYTNQNGDEAFEVLDATPYRVYSQGQIRRKLNDLIKNNKFLSKIVEVAKKVHEKFRNGLFFQKNKINLSSHQKVASEEILIKGAKEEKKLPLSNDTKVENFEYQQKMRDEKILNQLSEQRNQLTKKWEKKIRSINLISTDHPFKKIYQMLKSFEGFLDQGNDSQKNLANLLNVQDEIVQLLDKIETWLSHDKFKDPRFSDNFFPIGIDSSQDRSAFVDDLLKHLYQMKMLVAEKISIIAELCPRY